MSFFPNRVEQFYIFKENAKQELARDNLAAAHQWYNATLSFFDQPYIPTQIVNEHHVILCNRSQVCYRQGLYRQSEHDALAAISICPTYVKAYWRVSQAILAKGKDGIEHAIRFLSRALSLAIHEHGVEQDRRLFLTEICKISCEAQMSDSLLEVLWTLELPEDNDKIWMSVIKRLCNENKWESMAMLVMRYEPNDKLHSLTTLDTSEWQYSDINVGKILTSMPDHKLAKYGEEMAICLLDKGASIQTIEPETQTNSVHFLVNLSLRIKSVKLLSHALGKYRDIREKINHQDDKGNTAFHLVVKSNTGNDGVCENIVVLLLKNKGDPFLQDSTSKKPIDYVTQGSKLFHLLNQKSNQVQELRSKLEKVKTEGNRAFQSKDFQKALQFYDEALAIAQQSPELYKEAAILYSNKSNVRFQTADLENALINAMAAVNSDPEYSKGYYWHSKALFRLGSAIEAFKTVIEGCSKSRNRDSVVELYTEAAIILNSLKGDEFQQCYQMLDHHQPTDTWKKVLIQLSKKSEWKSIAYLILGSNLEAISSNAEYTGGRINQLCAGVAGRCPTVDLETRTVFNFLRRIDQIPAWVDVVVFAAVSHGGDQTIKNFAENESDCPLHAVLRFVLKTGSTTLLEIFPQNGPKWSEKNSLEETGFHVLAKNQSPAVFLEKVSLSLIQKGYRDILGKDKKGKVPFDHLHDKYPYMIYDLFLPDNKPLEFVYMKRLSDIGFQKHDAGEHQQAVLIFSKVLRIKVKTDSDLRRMNVQNIHAFVLKNRANSNLNLGDVQKAFNDASKSIKIKPTYDAYLLHAQASTGLKRYETAFEDCMTAFTYATKGEVSQVIDVCENLAKFLHLLPSELSNIMMQRASRLLQGNGPIWAKVCYNLVLQNEWKIAEIAYFLFQFDNEVNILPLRDSLEIFCNIKDIRSNPWCSHVMLYFLQCGSNKRTIRLDEGDTYLHAAVRISLVTSLPELVKYLMNTANVTDRHQRDKDGNTLLHIATKEKKVDKNIRFMVIKVLLKYRVDGQILNKDNKTAESYLSGEKKSKDIIVDSIQRNNKGNQKGQCNREQTRGQANGSHSGQHTRKERKRLKCEKCDQLYASAVKIVQTHKTLGFKEMTEILIMDHTDKYHASIEKKVVEEVAKYIESEEDLATCLTPLRKEKYIMIIEGLFVSRKWAPLVLAINGYNKRFGGRYLKNFASKFSIESLVVDTAPISDDDEFNYVCCLLDNDWQIGDDDGKITLKKVFELKKIKLGLELIKRSANMSMISLQEGDTPIHALINIAIQVKDTRFIEEILDKWINEKDKYSYLDPEQVDANGDCVYHLLAKSNYSDLVLQITEVLCDKNVSADYYNKESKYPSHYVKKKKHFRLRDFIENARKIKASREQIVYETVKGGDKNTTSKAESKLDQGTTSQLSQKSRKEQIQESRNNIELLILMLPEKIEVEEIMTQTSSDIGHNEEVLQGSQHVVDDSSDKMLTVVTDKEQEDNINDVLSEDSDSESDDISESPPAKPEDDDNASRNREMSQVLLCKNSGDNGDEQNMFENLPWEVECTDKVLKVLEDKHVKSNLKKKIVEIIQRLASGDWQRNYHKEFKNVPKSLKLYEAKLSKKVSHFTRSNQKGRRIIWENAISFSARCSVSADNRLKQSAKQLVPNVRGGRIYSQLIRVWDVVMDHDKIRRSVDNIKQSHERGNDCTIQRKLKGLRENEERLRKYDKTFPLLFTENEPDATQISQEQVNHIPPASSNKTEYHILKFYPVDTPLVKHFLQNSDIKVDFPFKVTDLEHAVINLSGKEAILLLGRSGTGKTTCCLYRLWSQYRSYWMNRQIDDPLLPGLEQRNSQQDDKSIGENTGASIDCVDDETENSDVVTKDDDIIADQSFEHFHQVFITKNQVLAAEVKKTFRDFKNAEVNLTEIRSPGADQPLPNRLQDLKEHDYPLFTTSRQMLCKLDASIGDPFFKREDDGSMVNRIDGWEGTDDGLTDLHFLDYESDDETDEKETEDIANETDKRKRESDVRREVTYEIFENEVWRKIENKTKGSYHPSLVWTEIMSFIKGSYESLSSKFGYLSKEEYMELGRKRAPNFSGQRDEVYDIFKLYEHYKRNHQMFDETDIVHDIFRRLAKLDTTPITLHQIYVDETQDFTQAELFLLIRLCKNPNDMFLTGDTAQSIMRGISFRFEDLKTLFFHIRQNTKEANACSKPSKSLQVNVPQLHQLTYNYRSHAGILSLASSILEVLVKFFPESFDRLEPDKGLFPGPEPILIESCTFSDLAVLLSGNRRETSNIEFGAHQVILVYNDEAKENLPEELSCGLVLTIYESKGLEFDDVLLFNFFKYSQASKEWRIVTKHLNELADAAATKSVKAGTEQCVRIDNDILMSKDRPRPLDFDPNQHKILCSELKQLYTALTRARVNVWIYDEDPDKRGPMFEYFKALNLVKPVDITELNEDSLSKVIFAENSSNQDWIKQGDSFMKNHLYSVAAQCFGKGGDRRKQMLAQAHDRALLASRRKNKFKEKNEMRDEFIFAAELYLNCQRYSEAAKCLNNAKEVKSAVSLYTKLGQFEKAAEINRRSNRIVECSRLYESCDKFNKAVSILYDNGVYDIAIDVLKRYKMREKEMEKNDSQSLDNLRANRPDKIHTVEKISLRAAEKYYGQKDYERMHEAVSRFRDEDDKIEFYKKHRFIDEAANLVAKSGKFNDAVNLYQKHGFLEEARAMAEKSKDEMTLAKTLLDVCRIILANEKETHDKDIIQEDLTKSLAIFQKHKDRNMTGQVLLMRAKVSGDMESVRSAGKEFMATRPFSNDAGYIECCNLLIKCTEQMNADIIEFLLEGAKCLFNVCSVFLQRFNTPMKMHSFELKKFMTYCQFYGIFQKGDANFEMFPALKPLCEKMLFPGPSTGMHEVVRLDAERCSHMIVHYLIVECKPWLMDIKNILMKRRLSLQMCESFKIGEECEGCSTETKTCVKRHEPYTKSMFRCLIETDVHLAEYEVVINRSEDLLNLCDSKYSKQVQQEIFDMNSCFYRINENEKHMACKYLLDDCLLCSGHPTILAEDSGFILKPATSKKVALEHMKHYLLKRWNESTHGVKKLKSRASHETEVFLLLEFAFHLFHFDAGKVKLPKKPKDYMLGFEQSLENELKADGNPKYFKQKEKAFTLMLSVVPSPQNYLPERVFLTCVAHRFTDAYERLIEGKPFDAILSFGKFQTLLSQRKMQDKSTISFYPEIHHYLFWLEFFSTVSFLVVAKLKSVINPEYTIIVPSSYIALLYYVESTFPKAAMSLVNSISTWTPKRPANPTDILLERIKRFAFVISGHAQIVKIPSLIEDACNESRSNFVLLERLLILNMTMLCNIGNGVPLACKSSLERSLNNALSSQNITGRLRKIHDQEKELENYENVIGCLEKLLELRKIGESLVIVQWMQGQKEKINVKPIDMSTLSSMMWNNECDKPVVETQTSVEDLPYDTEQTEDEIRADLKEKEDFGNTIETEEDKPSQKAVNFDWSNDVVLDNHSVDDQGCSICDVPFDEYYLTNMTEIGQFKVEETSQTSQQNETNGQAEIVQRQDSTSGNTREMLDKGKLYHVNSSKHRENIKLLQSFHDTYKRDIEPLVTETEEMLQDYNYTKQHSETYKREMKGIEVSHERIKEELKGIKVFAEGWQKRQIDVIPLVQKLKANLELLKNYKDERMNNIQADIELLKRYKDERMNNIQNVNDGAVGNEMGVASNDSEGSDIENVVQEPVQHKERIQSKRQRKNEKRRYKAKKK